MLSKRNSSPKPWRKDQATNLPGKPRMSAKRAKMGRFTPKCPELDKQAMEWFSQQREKVIHLSRCEMRRVFTESSEIVFQYVGSKESDWWSEIRCCHDNFKASKERCSH